MNKTTKSGIQMIFFAVFMVVLATGIIIGNFPSPLDQSLVLTINKEGWVDLHRIIALLFVTLILLHLVQNAWKNRFLKGIANNPKTSGAVVIIFTIVFGVMIPRLLVLLY